MTTLPSPSGLPRLSRRDLLIGGSALALAATIVGRGVLPDLSDPVGLSEMARSAGPRISVGFLDRLPDGGRLDLSGRPDIVPAATVRPDAQLVGTGRGRVAGPTPGALEQSPAASIRLDTVFPHPDGAEPLHHQTWTYRNDPQSISPPARFVAPIGPMSLGFAMTTLDDGGTREAITVWTADDDDLPGLRPGTYLLGMGEGVWDAPSRIPAVRDSAWADLRSLAVTISPR